MKPSPLAARPSPSVKSELAEQPIAAAIATGLNYNISFEDSREGVIEAVRNSRVIPLCDQESIIARVQAVPEGVKTICVAAVCHPHKDGSNCTFTVW